MSEFQPGEVSASLADPSLDVSEVIASLRQAGAGKFDPVWLYHLQVLACRVNAHQGPAKKILDAKLEQALTIFRERFAQAQGDTREHIEHAAKQFPQAKANLQRLFESGDFSGVRRTIASLKERSTLEPLGELTHYLEKRGLGEPAESHVEGILNAGAGSHSELKTTRNFRNTWSKLSVEKRVAKEMDQAPKNAGPINSHMLVLRSLAMMRDISPDYLNRFTSYVDTLLCLDQFDQGKSAPSKKTSEGENNKKMRNRRGLSR